MTVFDDFLKQSGCTQVSVEPPRIIFDCTLTEDPARRILTMYSTCQTYNRCPPFDDILRAIAHQHPGLVDEFKHLPWPHLHKLLNKV